MNPLQIKANLLQYYNGRSVRQVFQEKTHINNDEVDRLWNEYIEFITIKIIGCDTGIGSMKYTANTQINLLWHTHVLCSSQYQEFMYLIKLINPLVDFLHPSLEMLMSSYKQRAARLENSAEAYRYLLYVQMLMFRNTQSSAMQNICL